MPAIIALKIGGKRYPVPRYAPGSNEILGDVGHTEEIGSRQTLHAGYDAGRTGGDTRKPLLPSSGLSLAKT